MQGAPGLFNEMTVASNFLMMQHYQGYFKKFQLILHKLN